MEAIDVAVARFAGDLRADLESVLMTAAPAVDRAWPAIVGWATVDLERAGAELTAELEPLARDEHLGGHAALARRSAASPLILLEPFTEGRLAASLARHGEGPIALYVVAATPLHDVSGGLAGSGLAVSAPAAGPLGRAILVRGPGAGPYLVLTERGEAGTIRA